jgi:hypothetical protein
MIKKTRQKTKSKLGNKRDYVPGESLYFQGIRYLLEVEEHTGYSSKIAGTKKIKLKVKLGATTEDKSLVMREW